MISEEQVFYNSRESYRSIINLIGDNFCECEKCAKLQALRDCANQISKVADQTKSKFPYILAGLLLACTYADCEEEGYELLRDSATKMLAKGFY